MDEKSFGKGHDYVSVMTDIDNRRVLEVAPERTTEAANSLWKTLSKTQRSEVESVSMDMWQAFMTSAGENAPNAEIVHDKFHISKYLGEAVDKVRRAENKILKKTATTGSKEAVSCGSTALRIWTKTGRHN